MLGGLSIYIISYDDYIVISIYIYISDDDAIIINLPDYCLVLEYGLEELDDIAVAVAVVWDFRVYRCW